MNTFIRSGLSLSIVMFLAAGCGADKGGDYEVSESALSGTVGGEPFTVKSGYAADKFGDGELWVELYNSEVEDPCNSFNSPEGATIILSATPEPMDEPLSLQNNITFSYGEAQNDVATEGRLIVDGMQGETLSGGLYAKMGDNEVDGTFTVPVCPSE